MINFINVKSRFKSSVAILQN